MYRAIAGISMLAGDAAGVPRTYRASRATLSAIDDTMFDLMMDGLESQPRGTCFAPSCSMKALRLTENAGRVEYVGAGVIVPER